MDNIENEKPLGWYTSILPELSTVEPVKYQPILNQLEYDQKAEEIIPDILNKFKIGKEPHSPVELGKTLEQMGCPHLYESVYKILTDKYHRRFNKIERQRAKNRRKR